MGGSFRGNLRPSLDAINAVERDSSIRLPSESRVFLLATVLMVPVVGMSVSDARTIAATFGALQE